MIRPDGYVKVLDFGPAKLAGREGAGFGPEDETRILETRDGVVLGTFKYMAPEQARGTDIDPRADLFAMGVLLYEMLAGQPPFTGGSAADIIGAVLLREPEALGPAVPPELGRIVMTALQKDRADRYQQCALMLQDLIAFERAFFTAGDVTRFASVATLVTPGADTGRIQSASSDTVAALPVPARPPRRRRSRSIDSVAVLPLSNQGADQELEYLCDGLTEILINNLSQIPRLRVMARSTVFRYKEQHADPIAVGRSLDVHAVLTGHVLQRAGAFVVGAELVDVGDGSRLWGTVLTRPAADVFALQAEISEEPTSALRLRLSRDERKRLGKRHTVNAEAYQLYLRGRYFLNLRTGDSLKSARSTGH
jgi:TolB-like protein